MKQKIFNKENEILLNQNNSNKLSEINIKYDTLNENKKELEKQVNALTFEIKNLNNELYNYKNLNEQLNKEKEVFEKQIMTQKDQLDKNSEIILKYESQLKSNQFIEGNLSEKNNMVNDMRNEILNLKEELEKYKNNNSNLEFELQKREISLTCQQNTLDKLQLESQNIKNENSDLIIQNEKLKSELSNYQRAEKNDKNIIEIQTELSKENDNLKINNDKLNTEIINLKNKLDTKNKEIETLTENNHLVKFITRC